VVLIFRSFREYDFTLFIVPILLSAFGVVIVYSSSMVTAVVEGFSSTHYLTKQFQYFVISLVFFLIFCNIPYRIYQRFIKLIIFGSILILAFVLMFGTEANQAVRSISLMGRFNLQPAEFVKIGLIIYLAAIYSKKQIKIDKFTTGVAPPLILISIVIGLIILQPDLGTSVIIIMIAVAILISTNIRFKHLFALGATAIAFILLAIPYMVTEKRIARITGAYQPFASPDDGGYHLIHSYLAIGNGGLTGEGLGQSVQKLGFLWGAHTDFIMAVIAEELGFFGVLAIIGLLAVIVLRGIYIAKRCNNDFGTFLAIGISAMVGIQATINLGAISGILPITGVPLPFLSYGGSSLLAMMISMGILNNIAKSVKAQPEEIREQSPTVERSFRYSS